MDKSPERHPILLVAL